MAARVRQTQSSVEVDTSALGEDVKKSLPSQYLTIPRRIGPAGAMSHTFDGSQGPKDQPDIYDNLHKGLEAIQCSCEHGAYQFLRDADCNEEIKEIPNKLQEVLLTSKEEVERVQREELELASAQEASS